MKTYKAKTHAGKPCAKCGGTERYSSSYGCIACARARSKAAATNPRAKVQAKAWRDRNKEKLREYQKKYKADPAKWEALTESRDRNRWLKIGPVPQWADMEMICTIYRACQILSIMTGEPWEVDHLIPLRHKEVSGLHAPNNLIIVPRATNQRKSNDFSGW